MATRRTASSRSRTNGDTNITRPKSVMAKAVAGASSSRISDNLESSDPPFAQRRNKEDGETNIQVILRCRGRSEREIQENSPAIVQIEGPKTNSLTIETSLPVSSLGMFNSPPTRTYPFDLVFGPEATQSMVYHEVVGPMLAEVLMGYNCTLFAYGQTGTGKT
jgi:kinesin family protein 11